MNAIPVRRPFLEGEREYARGKPQGGNIRRCLHPQARIDEMDDEQRKQMWRVYRATKAKDQANGIVSE